MEIKLVSAITGATTIARGPAIRELSRLRKFYSGKNWRKRKGFATIRLPDGTIIQAELHWYEAHGIGKCEMKVKRFLDK